ncbi:hypothetical protein CCR75_008882 [Bremia lactucae]|uniref:RWP-RK domain-containing protein n=1 Tax=Bremia lactucae TaxID=4779 RepID=A0A976IJ34_BRELC|nr:hypothetical protein CCR75_008882 [Bremia lactucae]
MVFAILVRRHCFFHFQSSVFLLKLSHCKHSESSALMLQQPDASRPLGSHHVSSLKGVNMLSPVISDGQATRVHAARKSDFLTMSPACNFEAFSLHFHLPLKVAAEKFGVRATAFKKRCRVIGIRHWPYRKVRSLKRSLQELQRCKEQAPLSEKQQSQYATYKRQLDRLLAPETYGLDPSGRLEPQHQQLLTSDDDDGESEDGNDSQASQSPRFNNEVSYYDYAVHPTFSGITQSDVVPAESSQYHFRRNEVMHLPPAHLSSIDTFVALRSSAMINTPQQLYSQFDGFKPPLGDTAVDFMMKVSPTYLNKTYVEDFPSSGFYSMNLAILPPETTYADVRSFNDADDEYTVHASQVDFCSERFFDDVFLQISPDYGCLV